MSSHEVVASRPVRPGAVRSRVQPSALWREAEAQQALAELFPHLQPAALRAIQELFPLAQLGPTLTQDSARH
jgi:hypothetical protein